MSRRKQGRPQQRLTLDAVEQENDRLVCGDCQTNFPLREITKFIRHKVNKCNKENNADTCKDGGGDGYDGDHDDLGTVISTKCTSISAPIARKESSLDGILTKSPRQSHGNDTSASDVKTLEDVEYDGQDEKDKVKDRKPLRLKQLVDAESNTTNSEPIKVTCETCRKTYNAAWSLLQHAQREHGMRIYATSHRDSYTPSQSPRVSTPVNKFSNKNDLNQREENKNHIKRDRDDSKERIRSDSTGPHRTGSASSGESPISSHPSLHNPFMFPRMPFTDLRHPLSPMPGMSPLSRPPSDLRFGLGQENPYHRTPEHMGGMSGLFGLPGFESGPVPFHPFEPHSRGNMSLDDFYSKRLRMLASSTSPSPSRKQTPPFTQASTPPSRPHMYSSSLTPPGTSTLEGEKQRASDTPGTQRSLTPPGNQKSCEFCNKTFRFQSNLIVHRRSHTGEKPFKCPLCPHACTQQSKLKRHMKTHTKPGGGIMIGSGMSNASEGSRASSSSTPNSNEMGNDEDEDLEDEEEYEEMEDEEDEMEIAALQELRDGMDPASRLLADKARHQEQHKGELGTKHGNDIVAQLLDRRIAETIASELSKDSETKKSSSLVSEVMENTGLTNIPNYNEALKLAMAEKFVNRSAAANEERLKNMSRDNDDLRKMEMHNREDKDSRGVKRENSDESSIMSISKMIKKEPNENKSGTPPVSTSAPRIMNNIEPSFYPSLWFPGATSPDFFNRFSQLPRYKMGNDGPSELPHNGFGLPPSSGESPLMNNLTPSSSCSTPTTTTPTNGMSSADAASSNKSGTPRSRKDMCDYCGKVFKNCSNLTVHRRSHTGEKPYKCMLCSYACAQSSKLTRHMKTHGRYGKDVYKCKFCNMPFSVPSTLEKHMRKCVENANAVLDGEDTNGSASDTASASDGMSAVSGTTTPLSLPSTPLSLASSLRMHPMPFSSLSSPSSLTNPAAPLAASLGLPMSFNNFAGPSAYEKSAYEKHLRKMAGENSSLDGEDSSSRHNASMSLPLSFPPAPHKYENSIRNNPSSVDGDDTGSNSDGASASEGSSTPSNGPNLPSSMSLSSPLMLSSATAAGLPLGLSPGFGSGRIMGSHSPSQTSMGLSQSLMGSGVKLETNLAATSPSI